MNKFPAALLDRLVDEDESVRKQVVSVVCHMAYHTRACMPVETVKVVSECLRDKSVSIAIYP